jgi:hypothetical protein
LPDDLLGRSARRVNTTRLGALLHFSGARLVPKIFDTLPREFLV